MGTDGQDRGLAGPSSLDELKEDLRRWWQRKLKGCLRKKETTQNELTLAERWEEVWQEAELLQMNLGKVSRGMKEFTVQDWWNEGAERVIRLDPTQTPQEEVQMRFRTAKKRKKGIPHLQKYLSKLDTIREKLEEGLGGIDACETEEEIDLLKKSTGHLPPKPRGKREKEAPALPYRRFLGPHGNEIWVGKGAKDNDLLTFRVANGNDWWFHVSGVPGSHVVVRLNEGRELDRETRNAAGLLALYFSKAKGREEGEVVYTQQKWVRRLSGGRPGQVVLAQHKSFFIRFDPEQFKEMQRGDR